MLQLFGQADKMENNNAPCLVLPNGDNYSSFLSTGYLEDALLEFSVRFKRRKLITCSTTSDHYEEARHDSFATHFTDDLSYWNNWLTNYNMHSQEDELSHASLLANHDMHYSSGEYMERTMQELCYYQETLNYNTSLLEEIVGGTSPKLEELSSCSRDNNNNSFKNNSTSSLVYCNNDAYYSTDTSSISGDKETKKNNKKVNRAKSSSSTKMVYPFGLVKPGGEDGDITLDDINKRMLMPPTRALKHPVGDYACRPAVSPHGPGLSGKAVVGLTKIQTQGRGTITIIRTKG